MSISAMKYALQALEDPWGSGPEGVANAIAFLRQAIAEAEKQEPVRMRMPKVGDRVICLEDETLGTVKYLTAGGSPEIKFDDGSYGTYLLREFAELFCYTAPVHASDISQEPVDETAKREHEPAPNDYDRSIHSNPDAQAWAKFFMATVNEQEWCIDDIDESLMTGWFANAMMAMHDHVKREWVGLTDEEIKKIVDLNTEDDYGYDIWCNGRAVARDVEAKLKEKNT
jgi:hypothetical protein